MILAEAPDLLAVTTATGQPLVRCLACRRAVTPGEPPDVEHWHHTSGAPDCVIVATRDGLRMADGTWWRGRLEPRPHPGPIPTSAWAAARLVGAPDAQLHPDAARADYLGWCSVRRGRPEPRPRMRAAIKGVGGRARGVREALRYLDVALDGPMPDSGYRVPGTVAGHGRALPAGNVTAALVELHRQGLVPDPRVLDRAWLALTGSAEAVVCSGCGQITRRVRERVHVGC